MSTYTSTTTPCTTAHTHASYASWLRPVVALLLVITSWNLYVWMCRSTQQDSYDLTPWMIVLEVSSIVFGSLGITMAADAVVPHFTIHIPAFIISAVTSRCGNKLMRWCPLLLRRLTQRMNLLKESSTPLLTQRRCVIFLSAVMLDVSVHVKSRLLFAHWHVLSRELYAITGRVVVDSACLLSVVAVMLCKRAVARLRSTSYSTRVIAVVEVSTFCLALWLCVGHFAPNIRSVDAMKELHTTISGVPLTDVCSLEGMHMKPDMAKMWILPKMIPRWTYDLIFGSQTCAPASWRSGGYIAVAERMLIVPSVCSTGEVPRILLERPVRNGLHGGGDSRTQWSLVMDIEGRYGVWTKAQAEGVIVRRGETGYIAEVQINPNTLVPVVRPPRSPAEARVRDGWPEKVLVVPLGRSPAYTVMCGEEEEVFMFPVNVGRQSSLVAEQPPTPGEPAGSMLVVFFDSVSRQAMVRSMPKFSRWVRRFGRLGEFAANRSASDGSERHMVVENIGHTTVGYNTAANLVPMLAGSSKFSDPYLTNTMNSTVFKLVKTRYGSAVETSFSGDNCEPTLEFTLGSHVPSVGAGNSTDGVDRYLFTPFCHKDYAFPLGTFKGPYSIRRRCIAKREVHEHLLDYVQHLMWHQLRNQQAEEGPQFFFDFVNVIEGHEATQNVLPLVDDAMTAFMEHLEAMHFFRNPLNTFLLAADHGNHMGYYPSCTPAGQLERASPMMMHIIHPEVMRRVDAAKGRAAGSSQENFLARAQRLSTPMDIYLSLCDVMNVTAAPHPLYMNVSFPPKSLFDPRPQKVHSCNDYHIESCREQCTLSFCSASSSDFNPLGFSSGH